MGCVIPLTPNLPFLFMALTATRRAVSWLSNLIRQPCHPHPFNGMDCACGRGDTKCDVVLLMGLDLFSPIRHRAHAHAHARTHTTFVVVCVRACGVCVCVLCVWCPWGHSSREGATAKAPTAQKPKKTAFSSSTTETETECVCVCGGCAWVFFVQRNTTHFSTPHPRVGQTMQ